MTSAFMEELNVRIDNVCSLKWNRPIYVSDTYCDIILDECRKQKIRHPAFESTYAFKNLVDYILQEKPMELFKNATWRKNIHTLIWNTCAANEPEWWPIMDNFTMNFLY
jgi:hypothetical protein